jgi:magnesium transporter
MITVYCWSEDKKTGMALGPEALTGQPREAILWVDLEAPTPEEEALVFTSFFPVHTLTFEDITRLRREPEALPHFPKAEEFPDYLFVVVNPLTPAVLSHLRGKESVPRDDAEPMITQLSAVLTDRLLITHHARPLSSIEELRSFLSRHAAQCHRGPAYLFHLILDAMVDQYAPFLDHLEDQLDEIELAVFRRPDQALLLRLLHYKRIIIALRKTLIYEREVLARLARGEFDLIAQREMAYYRNVYDHLIRFTELIESSREMVSDLMQTHLAAAANKLNEIMKILTMISTTLLPMTLIAGIYGMNFVNLPEKDWDFGYPFALALMLVAGIASFVFFRWKKWI